MSTSESLEERLAPPAHSMLAGFGSSNTWVSFRCISSKQTAASASPCYEYSATVVDNGSVLLKPSSSSLKKEQFCLRCHHSNSLITKMITNSILSI
ncbi:hypothetical protein ACFX2A_020439 [Malus domestica]